MKVLFTAKNISEKHQHQLNQTYPEQTLIFCKDKLDIMKNVQEAEVIVTYGGDLTDEMLQSAPNVRWIQVISAGVDRLPRKTIEKRKIMVTNVSGIHKIPMSEYAISMLLQAYRNEKAFFEDEQNKVWNSSHQVKEITGRTMIVLGTGAIGQETARLAKAFNIKTIGVSRSGRAVEFFDETHAINEINTVLPQADFVVSVLPSTNETRELITFKHFQRMNKHTIFLNMGRGDLFRSDDLLKALQQGEIAHAILDVTEEEPLPKDHHLWKEARVTITPHISGASPLYLERALEIFEYNFTNYLEGTEEYKNKIDLKKGY